MCLEKVLLDVCCQTQLFCDQHAATLAMLCMFPDATGIPNSGDFILF